MRVSQTGNNPVQGTDSTNKSEGAARTQRSKKSEGTSKTDSVNEAGSSQISGKAKDAAKARSMAAAAPEVREEKIAELRRRIAEGKYKVDADAVADRMVDDHISMNGMS